MRPLSLESSFFSMKSSTVMLPQRLAPATWLSQLPMAVMHTGEVVFNLRCMYVAWLHSVV